MNKAKMLSLTAGLVLAITFTLSCSDDKDDPPTYTYGTGSCYSATTPIPGVQVCMKFKADATVELCQMMSEDNLTLTYRETSCEPNPTLNCEEEKVGMSFYGTLPAGTTCETIKDL